MTPALAYLAVIAGLIAMVAVMLASDNRQRERRRAENRRALAALRRIEEGE